MIKEEKVNRRKALKRVFTNINLLDKSNKTIKDIFEISFIHPNFTMLNVMGVGGYKNFTYGEIKDKAYRFANYFLSNITGCKYVGILLDNSQYWITSFYGLLMAGFIPVLLSTKNDKRDNDYVCKQLDILYLITENKLYTNYKIINPKGININDCSNNPVNNWENSVVFLTSGTSGKPKIVFYTGKELSEQIHNGVDIAKENKLITKSFKGYLKHLVILPFYHVFGFIAVFLWFSFFNVTFIFPVNLSNMAIQQACILTKPTHIFAVPLFWEKLCEEIYDFADKNKMTKKLNKGLKLSYNLQKMMPFLGNKIAKNVLFNSQLDLILGKSVQFCISGGSFIKSETIKTVNSLGYNLFNGYGGTEIGITSFCFAKNIKNRMIGSIGTPFKSVKYSIINDELNVSGNSVSVKIIKDGQEILTQQTIKTSDIVKNVDGDFYILGRSDEIVVDTNGENYSIPAIESKLNFKYASNYLVLYDDKKDYFILIVSYEKTVLTSLIQKEINDLKCLLSSLKIMDVFYTFYSFPKANDIKIKRNEVIQHFKNNSSEFILFKEVPDYQIETNDLVKEEILNAVLMSFSTIFPNKKIEKNSNFYTELGGDSLRYITLVTDINTKFNIMLDMSKSIPLTPEQFALVIVRSLA